MAPIDWKLSTLIEHHCGINILWYQPSSLTHFLDMHLYILHAKQCAVYTNICGVHTAVSQ